MDKETQPQAHESDIETGSEKAPVPIAPGADFPDGGLRAWSVAIGAAGILFCTFGYANAFGIFQEYYQTHQLKNETPSAISWIGSLQIFILFAGNVVGGPLFDRYGEKIIWPAALAYLLSVFMTSLCTKYYQFMLAQGILGGLAMGMTMSPSMATTGQWFHKNRGAAMGLAVAGSSLGGVIWPIALSKMLSNPNLSFGWTIRICGFIMLAVIVPSAACLRARLPPRKSQFFLPQAFKEIKFVTIVACLFLILMGIFMPFFYLPTFAIEHGMSNQLASYLVSMLNGASFFGRVIPGVLGDKLGRMNALAAAAISSGILIFCMMRLNSNASIIVFSVLYGFCSGAIVSGMTVVMAQIPLDPRNIGTYMGMGMGVVGVAALIGPPIDGAFVNKFHGFSQVEIFSGVVVLVGGLGVVACKVNFDGGLRGKN